MHIATYNMENIYKQQLIVLGAICGDIIGSSYEFNKTKDYNFELLTDTSRFTDDTVCTIAIADAVLNNKSYVECLKYWCCKYSYVGYGPTFRKWLILHSTEPYYSWGNGSAMRVSSIGALLDNIDDVLNIAKQSAEVTHNHPEGIKGAQATALSIMLAKHIKDKNIIKSEISDMFEYDLSRIYSDIQPDYKFEVSCQKSVPESIICFLESNSYIDTIRKCVSMGGDADTMSCIAGGIAAAYYEYIPEDILSFCLEKLPADMMSIIKQI